MQIKIGVQHSPKEIEIEVDDADRNSLIKEIDKAMATDNKVLWLTDKKGRQIGVRPDKVTHVEVGATGEMRRMGFVE